MNIQESIIHSQLAPRNVRPLDLKSADEFRDLAKIGITIPEAQIHAMAAMAMDTTTIQPTVTTGSINTPVQFLQAWLPGFVYILTQARKIDELLGLTTIGNWYDEQVVQGVMELTGTSVPYGDYTNVPLSSWNVNFETRTVVRFEEGMQVGVLEEQRAAAMRVSSSDAKRQSAGLALEIQRNAIGFYGYNDGAGKTYGLLNDPNLPNYVTVAATGTDDSTFWADKSYTAITQDIITAVAALRTQSGANVNAYDTPTTLAVASSVVDQLAKVNDLGTQSVMQWIKQTYPKMRVVDAPQFDAANGSENVFYLYAEKVADNSTDGGSVFSQLVPTKFMVVGVARQAKGYLEDYANSTAGVLLKRPYAVVRRTGI